MGICYISQVIHGLMVLMTSDLFPLNGVIGFWSPQTADEHVKLTTSLFLHLAIGFNLEPMSAMSEKAQIPFEM